MNFFNMALDFIFPPICGICGEINKNYICTKCYKDIRKLEIGDYVVHAINGIGIYNGIKTLNHDDLLKDWRI